MKASKDKININFRHLRALHAVSDHGSFGAAAEILGVGHSALSELIRHLERDIGALLFDRRTRPPVLTPLGRDFLKDTAPLVDGMERAVDRLRQRAGLETGTLYLGASPSAISEMLAPTLTRFLEGRPGIKCIVHDDIAEKLADMVVEGRLDLAIAGRAKHSAELRQRAILSDPIGLACTATDPLTERGTVTLDAIPAERLIGLDSRTGTQQLLATCDAIPREYLSPRLMAHSTIAQLCMIRAGLGIALLPRNAVRLFRDPDIHFVEVGDLDLWRSLYLLEPVRRPLTEAARSFVETLEQEVPALSLATSDRKTQIG